MLLVKHLGGPSGKGPHPDGSPQSVHTKAGRAAWKKKQAGRVSGKVGLPRGIKPSSLDGALSGKSLGKMTVDRVYKSPDPAHAKDRLVTFKNGGWKYVPSAALANVAFGGKAGAKSASPFKSDRALHASGFTSHLQAAYLKRAKPAVYEQIIQDAKAGRRRWNSKLGKIELRKGLAPWISNRDRMFGGAQLCKMTSDVANDLADDDTFAALEIMSDEQVAAKWFSDSGGD